MATHHQDSFRIPSGTPPGPLWGQLVGLLRGLLLAIQSSLITWLVLRCVAQADTTLLQWSSLASQIPVSSWNMFKTRNSETGCPTTFCMKWENTQRQILIGLGPKNVQFGQRRRKLHSLCLKCGISYLQTCIYVDVEKPVTTMPKSSWEWGQPHQEVISRQLSSLLSRIFSDLIFSWVWEMAAAFWPFFCLSRSHTKQEKEVCPCLLLVFCSISRHNLFWLFCLLVDVRYEGIYLWSTAWEYNEISGVRIFTSHTFRSKTCAKQETWKKTMLLQACSFEKHNSSI